MFKEMLWFKGNFFTSPIWINSILAYDFILSTAPKIDTWKMIDSSEWNIQLSIVKIREITLSREIT